ncbi:MAG: winged helix-turn-helix transcriptional regulator [Chloroflexi bacterium]|nr:winged helix-turn-helix transcriptional regulator [Chloroflexota bacterium]
MAADPYAALASATRRAILELLRDNPGLSAGEVAAAFPRVSRPAVARHVGVLRRAGLVRATRRGRESHFRVEAAPIAAIYREFLRSFVEFADESLVNLKRIVEEDEARPED